jgi:glycosyltransferase involved in cell wall biosynthesis
MLFVISEVYFPEEAGTAHYMTGIAEGLASKTAVRVICARPKYERQWDAVPAKESHKGVSIQRCWATTFDKNRLAGRIANVVTASLSIFLAAVRQVRKDDRVLVVTSPPLLPFVAAAACRLRGARCFLKIDDVFPEAMIHSGLLRPGSIAVSFMNWMNRALYRRVERIVVLGRDMRLLVEKKLGGPGENLLVIPNWADVDTVVPSPKAGNRLLREHALENKFVVGYAGNLGRVQAVEAMFETARLLKGEEDVHFMVVGSGQKAAWLESAVAQAGLTNITLAGWRPRAQQCDFLNACDLGLVSLVRGMAGIGVPSRLYNVMAAGKPVLAMIDQESEPAMVVREESIGWVVPPDQPRKAAAAILDAKSDRGRLARMGATARKVAAAKYSRERILAAYESLLWRACRGTAPSLP